METKSVFDPFEQQQSVAPGTPGVAVTEPTQAVPPKTWYSEMISKDLLSQFTGTQSFALQVDEQLSGSAAPSPYLVAQRARVPDKLSGDMADYIRGPRRPSAVRMEGEQARAYEEATQAKVLRERWAPRIPGVATDTEQLPEPPAQVEPQQTSMLDARLAAKIRDLGDDKAIRNLSAVRRRKDGTYAGVDVFALNNAYGTNGRLSLPNSMLLYSLASQAKDGGSMGMLVASPAFNEAMAELKSKGEAESITQARLMAEPHLKKIRAANPEYISGEPSTVPLVRTPGMVKEAAATGLASVDTLRRAVEQEVRDTSTGRSPGVAVIPGWKRGAKNVLGYIPNSGLELGDQGRNVVEGLPDVDLDEMVKWAEDNGDPEALRLAVRERDNRALDLAFKEKVGPELIAARALNNVGDLASGAVRLVLGGANWLAQTSAAGAGAVASAVAENLPSGAGTIGIPVAATLQERDNLKAKREAYFEEVDKNVEILGSALGAFAEAVPAPFERAAALAKRALGGEETEAYKRAVVHYKQNPLDAVLDTLIGVQAANVAKGTVAGARTAATAGASLDKIVFGAAKGAKAGFMKPVVTPTVKKAASGIKSAVRQKKQQRIDKAIRDASDRVAALENLGPEEAANAAAMMVADRIGLTSFPSINRALQRLFAAPSSFEVKAGHLQNLQRQVLGLGGGSTLRGLRKVDRNLNTAMKKIREMGIGDKDAMDVMMFIATDTGPGQAIVRTGVPVVRRAMQKQFMDDVLRETPDMPPVQVKKLVDAHIKKVDRYISGASQKYVWPEDFAPKVQEAMQSAVSNGRLTAGAALGVLEDAIPQKLVQHVVDNTGLAPDVVKTAVVFNRIFGSGGIDAATIYSNVIKHPMLRGVSEHVRKSVAADIIDQTLPQLTVPDTATVRLRVGKGYKDVKLSDFPRETLGGIEDMLRLENKNLSDFLRMDALPEETLQHFNRHMALVPKKSRSKAMRYAKRMALGEGTMQDRADFAEWFKSALEKSDMDADSFKSEMFAHLTNQQGLDSLLKRKIPTKLFRGPEWAEQKTRLQRRVIDSEASLYQTARTIAEQRLAIDAIQGVWGESVFAKQALMEVLSGGLTSPETVARYGKALDGISGLSATEKGMRAVNVLLDTAETMQMPIGDSLKGVRRLAEAKGWTNVDGLMKKAGVAGNLPKGIYANPEVRGFLEHLADMRKPKGPIRKLNDSLTKSFKTGKVVLSLSSAVRDMVYNKLVALPIAGVPAWSKMDTVGIRALASDAPGMKRLLDTVGASGGSMFQREIGTQVRVTIPWGIQDGIMGIFDEIADGVPSPGAIGKHARKISKEVSKMMKTQEGRKTIADITGSAAIDTLDEITSFFVDVAFRPDRTKIGQALIANRSISDDAARAAVGLDRVLKYGFTAADENVAKAMNNLLEHLGVAGHKGMSTTTVSRAIMNKIKKLRTRAQGNDWFHKWVDPVVDAIPDDLLREITKDAVTVLPNYADKSKAWRMITNNLFSSPFLYFTAKATGKVAEHWLNKPLQAHLALSSARAAENMSWQALGGKGPWEDVRRNLPAMDQYATPWAGSTWSSDYVQSAKDIIGLDLAPMVPVSRTGEDRPYSVPPAFQAISAVASFVKSAGEDVSVPQVYDPKSGRVIPKRITERGDSFASNLGTTGAYLYDLLGPAGDLLPVRPGFREDEPVVGSPATRGAVRKMQGKYSPDWYYTALRAFGPRTVPIGQKIAGGRELDSMISDIAKGREPRVSRLVGAIGQDLRTPVTNASKELREASGKEVRRSGDGGLSVSGENIYRGRMQIQRADAFVTNATAAMKFLGDVANGQMIANTVLGADNASLIDFSSDVLNDLRISFADTIGPMEEVRDALLAGQEPSTEALDKIASMWTAPLGNPNVTWEQLMGSAEMQQAIKAVPLPREAQQDAAMARINGIDKRLMKAVEENNPKALEAALYSKAGLTPSAEAQIMSMLKTRAANIEEQQQTRQAMTSLLVNGPLGTVIPRAKRSEGKGWFSERPVNHITSWYQAPGLSDTRRDEIAGAIMDGKRFLNVQDVVKFFNDRGKRGEGRALSAEERTTIRRLFEGSSGGTLEVPR